MQAASSSHRYASQLTSIGVGQSGNPILSAVSACERCECEGSPKRDYRRQAGIGKGARAPLPQWGLVPPFPST